MPRRKKPKEQRSRNPVLLSDVTKRELEKIKVEKEAESFDDAIRRLIEESEQKDRDNRDSSFMSF